MANIKKSFNFRNGVQVDDDNFIVNSNGLVGIGSTIPTESLDVGANIRVRGSLIANIVQADSIINESENGSVSFNLLNVGLTSITSGIISASSGIVTYYGDAQYLQNMPTSQWIDVDSGFGYTSIYAAGNVGVSTTYPDYTFQVGVTTGGVGITSDGDVVIGRNLNVSGVGTIDGNLSVGGITTSYSFSGFGTDISGINASNISTGTINEQRLPSNINKISGIATFSSFHGNLVGIATTSINLVSGANIDITSIDSDYSNLGVTTASSFNASVSIGIGTNNPNSDFHLRKTGSDAELQITSDSNIARIVLGNDVTINSNNTIFSFNDTSLTAHPESGENCFDIKNYAPGNFNSYLRPQSDPEPLKFNWINDLTNSVLMSLLSNGNLGIGRTNPSETFEVVGTSTVTNTSYFGSDVYVDGTLYPSTLSIETIENVNINAPSGIVTALSFVGLGSNLTNISPSNIDSGTISNISINSPSGIVTALSFVGLGSNLTNISPSNIDSGTILNISINSPSGIVTAGIVTGATIYGDGSNITSLTPENILTGTIANVSINSPSGIVTALSFVGLGSNLTNISPSNINSGTISNISINSPSGIVTASSFNGDGSNITSLTPENIDSGTITNVSINSPSGIITAGIVTGATIYGDGANITLLTPENISSGTIANISINSPSGIITAGIVTSTTIYGDGSNITSLTPQNINSGTFNGSSYLFPSANIGILTSSVDNSDIQVRNIGINCGIDTFAASVGVSTWISRIATSSDKMSEYAIHFEYSNYIQVEKIILTYNGTTGLHTTYGSMSSPSNIVEISSSYSGGFVYLNVTPNAGITGIVTYRYHQKVIYS